MKNLLIILIFSLFSMALIGQSFTDHTYTITDDLFLNPERGLSAYKSSAVSVTYATNLRNDGLTIAQRIYNTGSYRTDSLSNSFLTRVHNDLTAAREGGIKLVMRYSYTDDQDGEDASLEWIQTHIDQLGPVWTENADAIAYVEAGFIGAWGEWYYSSNDLDNTSDRRSVLFKELEELPANRMVVIRTPGYKKAIFSNNDPLSLDSAFSETYRARTGAHNDCFLASATDYGTYGNIEADKTYLNLDNRYVPQGGETCNPSAYSGCENALIDLARMRWSVLNRDYHPEVIDGWEENGCWPEIQRRLGYRFQLLDSRLQNEVKPGGMLESEFSIFNEGFASPYNPRNCELVIRHQTSQDEYTLLSLEDPRWWMGGDTAYVSISGGIPEGILEGSYDMFMHLSDPVPALRYRHEFAIHLANEDIWEAETGYNDLGHTLTISSAAPGEDYSGELFFELIEPTSIDPGTKILRPGSFEIRAGYPNPFNGNFALEFEVLESAPVLFEVFNQLGQKIAVLSDEEYFPGEYSINWKPDETVSSGLYFIRASTYSEAIVQKATYLK
ncbi:DUF4832 domain-containing protein [bacterium]|nr:DUF4832 domain-containing protein [bacterium]